MMAAFMRLALGLACLVPVTAVPTAHVSADTISWRQLTIEGHRVSWQRPAGERLVLTWRIAAGEESYGDAVNCKRIGQTTPLLARSRLQPVAIRDEAIEAFAMWQQVADITFVEAAPEARADITIGAQLDPIGRAFTDVQFDRAATDKDRAITRSLICLNPQVHWKAGFDGNLDVYDLRVTLAHEIGHAIGLDHPDGPGQLMWFRYAERSRHLQAGDVAGAVAIYGAPRAAVGQIASH